MAAAKFFFLSEMIMECLSTVFDLCKINTYLQHTKGNLISNPTWILDINGFPDIKECKNHKKKII